MNKCIKDGYIIAVGDGVVGEPIPETEYNNLLTIIHNRPTPPTGFDYMLTADSLEWELVELPPIDDDTEATEFDYVDALNTLGVNTNEEN